MDFFRKYFVSALLVCVGLVVLASVIPYFTSKKESQEFVREIQSQEQVIPFTHEGNLTFFAPDGNKRAAFEIEFAQGEYETALGLMYRKQMPENQAMLFLFPQEEMRSFWMKNTYIALDIIYLNAEKKVVSIAKNARPMSEDSRPSEAPAMYVLEVNAGVSDKYGIQAGDTMTFEKIN